MILANPFALFGLLAIAVPLIIHLLSRTNARRQQFPSLRFLVDAPVVEARRTVLQDLFLLALRAGIVAAAAIALARPIFLTDARRQSASSAWSRAIVVDTSSSMRRSTVSGKTGLDIARDSSQQIARRSASSMIFETSLPARSLAGAAEWLQGQSGNREIVLLSDFQLGTTDSAQVAALPVTTGIRLVRIDSLAAVLPESMRARSTIGSDLVVASAVLRDGATDARWQVESDSLATGARSIQLLAGVASADDATAAMEAALSIGAPLTTSDAHPIAIVYRNYERFGSVAASAQPIADAWMWNVVAHIRSDALFRSVAAASPGKGDSVFAAGSISVVARNADRPVVAVGSTRGDSARRMLVFVNADAGSITSAALIASVLASENGNNPFAELEPEHLSDATLRAMERQPDVSQSIQASALGDLSDGRWFWIAALLLLMIETVVRSRPARVRSVVTET